MILFAVVGSVYLAIAAFLLWAPPFAAMAFASDFAWPERR